MRFVLLGSVALLASGCAEFGPRPAELARVSVYPAVGQPGCQDYSARARIDAKVELLVGRACRQADGGWQVTEGPQGDPKPSQVYASAATSARAPWFSGPPVGISLGRLVMYNDWERPGESGHLAALKRDDRGWNHRRSESRDQTDTGGLTLAAAAQQSR